jgi:hypothetical protein
MSTSIKVFIGAATDLPFGCFLRPTGATPAAFDAGDTLSAAIYQARVPTPICTPAVEWWPAPDKDGVATQTGYEEGEVVVRLSNAEAAKFVTTTSYLIVVWWSPASDPGDSAPIVYLPLAIRSPFAA